MRISSLASALLIAPLLLALSPRADEISFHPEDGSKLTKQFTITGEIELGDVTLDVNGQDMTGELPSDVSAGFEVTAQIVDRYVKVEGGKPLELLRQFLQFSGSYHAMEESGSTGDFDGLGSRKVRFKWNEDTERYDISSDDGEPVPDEARIMGVDMDLRSLLPGKSVTQNDSWNVDGKQLATALVPGIDLGYLPELKTDTDDEDAEAFEMFKRILSPEFERLRDECKAVCDYSGQREVDGRTLAVIKLRLDITGKIDMSELVRLAMTEGGGLEESDFTIGDASLDMKLGGEGELLWDISAGTAHAFDFSAKFEFSANLAASITAEGETVDVEGEAELTGKSHWTMELK
ncbi:MAG: hypothetical protein ABI054_12945 [Planctomycetota bacterium]